MTNNLNHLCSVCGSLGDACNVFDEMLERDSMLWNALKSCFCESALIAFVFKGEKGALMIIWLIQRENVQNW